jgi:hypothetical protein
MIRRLVERRRRDDEGSIVMAMLAIVVVTGLLTLGLATILSSHLAARHDVAFESALTGAERGLDELVAQAKANPTASSFLPVTGTASPGVSYSATATAVSGGWLVDSTGTATNQGRTVTRHIQATVSIGDLLSVPLFGKTGLNLGNSDPSAVDRYDSAVSSDVCTTSGTPTSMSNADTRMCTHAAQVYGAAVTDGPLTMRAVDLPNMSGVSVFNVPAPGFTDPDATGACAGDAGVQAACGSTITTHHERLDFPSSTVCSQGIGAGTVAYDGTTALAANAVYSFTNVTMNATAIANLTNISGSQIIICFNGTLTIPAGLSLNSTVKCSPVTTPSCTPTELDPRAPSSLLLLSTSGGASTPAVNLGAGSSSETSLSAVVYAPDANCSANGHVDVYGLLVCKSLSASGGADVHYDTEIDQLNVTAGFDRPVTVSGWREL